MSLEIALRDVVEGDFPVLLEHQRDAISSQRAAFGTKDVDADAFAARWRKNLADGTTTAKVIVEGNTLVGFVATFLREGKPQVTYWIDRAHWGRGIATAALSELLRLVPIRPMYASAAADNAGSVRVLQKCGFVICGTERAFATARGEEIDEVFLELR